MENNSHHHHHPTTSIKGWEKGHLTGSALKNGTRVVKRTQLLQENVRDFLSFPHLNVPFPPPQPPHTHTHTLPHQTTHTYTFFNPLIFLLPLNQVLHLPALFFFLYGSISFSFWTMLFSTKSLNFYHYFLGNLFLYFFFHPSLSKCNQWNVLFQSSNWTASRSCDCCQSVAGRTGHSLMAARHRFTLFPA